MLKAFIRPLSAEVWLLVGLLFLLLILLLFVQLLFLLSHHFVQYLLIITIWPETSFVFFYWPLVGVVVRIAFTLTSSDTNTSTFCGALFSYVLVCQSIVTTTTTTFLRTFRFIKVLAFNGQQRIVQQVSLTVTSNKRLTYINNGNKE